MNPTTQPSEGAVGAADEYPITRKQRLVINDAATVLGDMCRRCPGLGVEVHLCNCEFMLEHRVAMPSALRQSARSLRAHRDSLGINGDQEAMALDLLADELEASEPCDYASLLETVRRLANTDIPSMGAVRFSEWAQALAAETLSRHTSTQGKEGKL